MANNIGIKDASSTSQSVKTTDNGGVHTPHHNVDTFPASWDGAKVTAVAALGAGGSGLIGWLSSIDGKLGGTLGISAAALPLPAGASTSANQATGNASLAAIQASVAGTLTVAGTVALANGTTVALAAGAATIGNVGLVAGSATVGKVDLNAGENRIGSVSSGMNVAQNFIVRPADTTAYAAGDLVGASTTPGASNVINIASVARAVSNPVAIRRMRLRKSTATLTNAQFRVHLFKTEPTVTVGDNGVLVSSGVLACDKAVDYLGAFDFTFQQAFSDGAMALGIPIVGGEILFNPTSPGTTLFAVIEARAAYTPGSSEAFTVILETFRD